MSQCSGRFSGFEILEVASLVGPGELYQWFPADRPESEKRTAWRIRWDYTQPAVPRSACNMLVVTGAWFQRSPNEDFLPVLSDLRLVEILVPRSAAERDYVIGDHALDVLPARTADLGPACVSPGRILDAYAVQEVHDDQLRWKAFDNSSRRGQILTLWAGIDAGNYQYFVEYGFQDDGTIVPRLGVAGPKSGGDPIGHLHIGCWRIEPNLGDPDRLAVQLSSFRQQTDGEANVVLQPFGNGREGGAVWTPEEFTSLRIVNTARLNAHEPPKPIGYDLITERPGTFRSAIPGEEFSQNDFWVTRASPESPGRQSPEWNYRDVFRNASHTELLEGHAVVIWHHSPIAHWPRSLAPYPKGELPSHTQWGGFMLRPRDLFSSTPLYP